MIRVEFHNVQPGPWAYEMTVNHEHATVLRNHGVPIAARLAFSGVERGILTITHDAERRTMFYEYVDVDETPNDCASKFVETHSTGGYSVFLNSHQLAKHQEEEEL